MRFVSLTASFVLEVRSTDAKPFRRHITSPRGFPALAHGLGPGGSGRSSPGRHGIPSRGPGTGCACGRPPTCDCWGVPCRLAAPARAQPTPPAPGLSWPRSKEVCRSPVRLGGAGGLRSPAGAGVGAPDALELTPGDCGVTAPGRGEPRSSLLAPEGPAAPDPSAAQPVLV